MYSIKYVFQFNSYSALLKVISREIKCLLDYFSQRNLRSLLTPGQFFFQKIDFLYFLLFAVFFHFIKYDKKQSKKITV